MIRHKALRGQAALAGRMAKGRPQWVEAVTKTDRLEVALAEGETTGRSEALAMALAEGADARAAAATGAAIVKEQWQPSSPAQARPPAALHPSPLLLRLLACTAAYAAADCTPRGPLGEANYT